MKKIIVLATFLVLLITTCSVIFADSIKTISETAVPVRINGIKQPIDTINVDDSIYVPIRDLCNYIDMNIEWNESEKTVELNSDNEEPIKEELGIPFPTIIDKDTAVKIADAVWRIDEKAVEDLELVVEESSDGKYYKVYRWQKGYFGGQRGTLINKADGKILGIGLGD